MHSMRSSFYKTQKLMKFYKNVVGTYVDLFFGQVELS